MDHWTIELGSWYSPCIHSASEESYSQYSIWFEESIVTSQNLELFARARMAVSNKAGVQQCPTIQCFCLFTCLLFNIKEDLNSQLQSMLPLYCRGNTHEAPSPWDPIFGYSRLKASESLSHWKMRQMSRPRSSRC